jgi:hypothetical protein
MSTSTSSVSGLEVRIEPSKQHTNPYDLLKMEKMFVELLFEAGYDEGTFRVKPGKYIHGTSKTAEEGITIGIPFEHALSCEIQTKSNDSRCEALLIPPGGTGASELARVLRDTLRARKEKKPKASDKEAVIQGEPEPEVPLDEEDCIILEEESLTERLVAIELETAKLGQEVLAIAGEKTALIEQETAQQSFVVSVQSEISDCEAQLARLQLRCAGHQEDLGKTQEFIANKNRQIEDLEKKKEALRVEAEKIQGKIEQLNARIIEIDRERLIIKVLNQTRGQLIATGLSGEEQIRLAEYLLAGLRPPATPES